MFFSIIIPCYNIEKYIGEALDSVANQTFREWECICINDGSSDGTLEVINHYASLDKRFRVFSQENMGVSSARNRGLKEKKGEWFLFLDGDDVFHPKVLELCNHAIMSFTECDAVVFRNIEFQEKAFLNVDDADICPEPVYVDCEKKLPYSLIMNGFWNCAYKSKENLILCFENYVVSEDRLFWINWLCHIDKVLSLDIALYAYRLRPGSATKSKETEKKVLDAFHASMRIADCLEDSGKDIDKLYLRRLNVFLFEMMANHIATSLENNREVKKIWLHNIIKLLHYKCINYWYKFFISFVKIGLPQIPLIVFCFCYKLKILRNTLRKCQAK